MTSINLYTPQTVVPALGEIVQVNIQIRDDIGTAAIKCELEYNDEMLSFLIAENGNFFTNQFRGHVATAEDNIVYIEMIEKESPIVRDAILSNLYFLRQDTEYPLFRFKPPDYANPYEAMENRTHELDLQEFLEIGEAPEDVSNVMLTLEEQLDDGRWGAVTDVEIDTELMAQYLATGDIRLIVPDVTGDKDLRIRVNIPDTDESTVVDDLEFSFREFQVRDQRGNVRATSLGTLTIPSS